MSPIAAPSPPAGPQAVSHTASLFSWGGVGSTRPLKTLFIPGNLQGSGVTGTEGIFSSGVAGQSALSDLG